MYEPHRQYELYDPVLPPFRFTFLSVVAAPTALLTSVDAAGLVAFADVKRLKLLVSSFNESVPVAASAAVNFLSSRPYRSC